MHSRLKIFNMNSLLLKRKLETVDRTREYKGRCVVKIKSGGVIELDVSAGNHEFCLKIDWCRSNVVCFFMNDKTIVFQCGNNVPLPPSAILKGFVGLLYITFWRGRYLWLKRI